MWLPENEKWKFNERKKEIFEFLDQSGFFVCSSNRLVLFKLQRKEASVLIIKFNKSLFIDPVVSVSSDRSDGGQYDQLTDENIHFIRTENQQTFSLDVETGGNI